MTERTLRERIQQPSSFGDGITAYFEAMKDPTKIDDRPWRPTEAQLRALIRQERPIPVADENGDIPCMRLWPVAQCQWTHAHYGGCATR